MNKRRIISLITIGMIILGTRSFATNKEELKTIERQDEVSIEKAEEYKSSINEEIVIDNVNYRLEEIKQTENIKTITKNKEITESLIVTTDNKYDVLNLFQDKKEINEDEYSGTLELQNNSLHIVANDTYTEEYKVYMQKRYENLNSNELNDIPKTIEKDGIIYYLVNPIWEVSDNEEIGEHNIPTRYNGTMNYEAVKTRNVVRNYIATVKYLGVLSKDIVDSITFDIQYKEVKKTENKQDQKEGSDIVPIVATTGGIIFFSGLILFRRKNVKVYNYKDEKLKLIRTIHLNKNYLFIDITPIKPTTSNKYRIVFSRDLFNKIKDRNIKIKYFDKEFIYIVKSNEIELYM